MLPTSDHRAPRLLFNGHLQTVVPHLFRRVALRPPCPSRLELPDGDFLDLDWYEQRRDRLVVLSHGLESNSRQTYVRGMAAAFVGAGWDALAWNNRTCGGEMNRLPRFYHHGDADDLAAVVAHAVGTGRYRDVVLVGFSMGGSQTLKYLGADPARVPGEVRAAVALSVPCDLPASIVRLHHPQNRFYKDRFLARLKKKMRLKALHFPEQIDVQGLREITTFPRFIERFMGPLHGFEHLAHFYREASAKHFLAGIDRPTLLINALNDPMLGPACFPHREAREHPHVWLETPGAGGHVGFTEWGQRLTWAERRALGFVGELGYSSSTMT
ncbi:MAG: alpha/beta fold hydrolase [Catalinimonas sp.]